MKSSLLFLAGLPFIIVAFIGAFAPRLNNSHTLFPTRHPISDCEGIVIDPQNHLYIGLRFYSRIQVYDLEGRFIKEWPIDSAGGKFKMRLNNDGHLDIATVRTDTLFTYDASGKLLQAEKGVGSALYEKWDINSCVDTAYSSSADVYRYFPAAPKDTYEYRKFLTVPRIIKISSSGKQRTIVSISFRDWLFMGFFPSWYIGMIGVILHFFAFRDFFVNSNKPSQIPK